MINNAKTLLRTVGLASGLGLAVFNYDKNSREAAEKHGLLHTYKEDIETTKKAAAYSGAGSMLASAFFDAKTAKYIRVGGFFGTAAAMSLYNDSKNHKHIGHSIATNATATGLSALAFILARKNIPIFQKEMGALLSQTSLNLAESKAGVAYSEVIKRVPLITKILNKDNVAMAVAAGVMPYSHAVSLKASDSISKHSIAPATMYEDPNTNTQRAMPSGTYATNGANIDSEVKMSTHVRHK